MNIFVKIKNTIYNPSYYSEVISKPFSYSLKYLLVFALLFGLVFTIVASFKAFPVIGNLVANAPKIAEFFPQELTITIKDGKASTNVQEPYYIKLPEVMNNDKQKSVENILVIDTKNKFDLQTFFSYKTTILLTSDSLVSLDSNGKVSIAPISSIKEFVLNRGTIVDIVEKIRPAMPVIGFFVALGIFFVGFMSVVLKMVYLLFGALLIWVVAKIKGLNIGYKGSYKVGMQLITAPVIIVSLLSLISFGFMFLFSILLIIFAALNLNKPVSQPI